MSPTIIAVIALTAGAYAPAQATDPASSTDDPPQQETSDRSAEDPGTSAESGILLFRSADGRSRFLLDTRVYLDAGTIQSSVNELPRGTEVRQVRIEFRTIVDDRWAAELDFDLADNEVDLKDLWIGYVGLPGTMIKAGNHKPPFSLEEQATSRANTFLERGLPNALVSGRRIGLSYQRWGRRWQAMAGLYGEEPGAGEEEGENEAWAAAGRVTYNLALGNHGVVHVGAAGIWATPDAGSGRRVRFRQRPEVHFTERLLNTGKIKDVDRLVALGIEAAAYSGPWQVQGEYMRARVHRGVESVNATFDGWYIFASRLLMGGQRRYRSDAGEFGPVAVERGEQAVEVAVRLSRLDLSDQRAAVFGGVGNNTTFALNWYSGRHVRAMFNYVLARHDGNADGDGDFLGDDDFSILAARLQFHF